MRGVGISPVLLRDPLRVNLCSPASRRLVRIASQAAISGQAVTGIRTLVPRRLRTQNTKRRWVFGSSMSIFAPEDRNDVCLSIDFTTNRGSDANPPRRHGVQAKHQTEAWEGGNREGPLVGL